MPMSCLAMPGLGVELCWCLEGAEWELERGLASQ